jgi:hypothetical protein
MLAALLALGAVAAPPTIAWEKNYLTISAPDIPGGPVKVLFLEAYCRGKSTDRDWHQTVIPHRTEKLRGTERRIELRCRVEPEVTVDHVIEAVEDGVSIRMTARNAGKEFADVQWGQHCMRVDGFTGLGKDDYWKRCFIVLDRGPTFLGDTKRTEKARYIPGQVYVPAGVDRGDVNPRPLSPDVPTRNVIGAVSGDGRKILAMAFEPCQELFQGVVVCIHADFRLGGLKPGETKELAGKIYLVDHDIPALLKKVEKDLPARRP